MSIGGHLREFRNRVLIAAAAILVGTVIGWQLWDPVYHELQQPLIDFARERKMPTDRVNVNFNGVTNPFTMKFKVAAWIGFILAAPVWLWQIWAFLVPGLTKKEKRLGRAFIGAAIPLFLGGVYMGYRCYGMTISVLMDATPDGAVNFPTASEYFSFVSRFILAFGLSFLMPVFLMALNTARILPARVMIKGWRFAIIAIVLFSALMTPTGDVWTMFIMSAPLIVLYYLTVALAALLDKLRARRDGAQRPAWMDTADTQASAL